MSEAVAFAVDMHVKLLDERVVERAKRRGLDAIVYAPHFTRLPEIRARAAAASDEELRVIPAREVFTGTWRERKHVLAVGLTDPVPDFIPLEGAMAEFRRQDAAVLVPHPAFATVSLDGTDVRRYRETIDAVEVYNPKHTPRHNERARELARESDMPIFGSSYAHLRGTVGEVQTRFEAGFDDEHAFVETLRSGVPRRVFHQPGPAHHLQRVAEIAHLGWENSWQKVDRVVLSGIEPTHPRHPAYEGRFDDVAVYRSESEQ